MDRVYTHALVAIFAAAALGCGDDSGPGSTGAGSSGPGSSGPGSGDGNGSGQSEPAWSYEIVSNPSGRPFEEGQGSSILFQPSGSASLPVQLQLSNAVPLYVLNFRIDTDDGRLPPPGSYPVSGFLWQTPELNCGSSGGVGGPPQMAIVLDSDDPVRGSFSGEVTCNGGTDDAYDVQVRGSFDDS